MQHNGMSKICGVKCRTDMEQSTENIPAAVKGTLDGIDKKFMQHNGIRKICGAKCYLCRYYSCLSNHTKINFFKKN